MDEDINQRMARLEERHSSTYELVIKKMAKQIDEIYKEVNLHKRFIDNAESEIERVASKKISDFQISMIEMTKQTLDWRKAGALISIATAALIYIVNKIF